jgi:hypothetical protein
MAGGLLLTSVRVWVTIGAVRSRYDASSFDVHFHRRRCRAGTAGLRPGQGPVGSPAESIGEQQRFSGITSIGWRWRQLQRRRRFHVEPVVRELVVTSEPGNGQLARRVPRPVGPGTQERGGFVAAEFERVSCERRTAAQRQQRYRREFTEQCLGKRRQRRSSTSGPSVCASA